MPSPNQRISEYVLDAQVGAGTFGQVWRARDAVVGREVALKTIRATWAGSAWARARFLREARITGRLEHPSIVPLYDLIDPADGASPCYAMRFVAGRTLAEAAAEYHRRRKAGAVGPLDLAALLDAFLAVCRAVAFAHSRGVLHRDLKGQNVVLGSLAWASNVRVNGGRHDSASGPKRTV